MLAQLKSRTKTLLEIFRLDHLSAEIHLLSLNLSIGEKMVWSVLSATKVSVVLIGLIPRSVQLKVHLVFSRAPSLLYLPNRWLTAQEILWAARVVQ